MGLTKLKAVAGVLGLCAAGAIALGDPVDVPVNQASSFVDVELCILGDSCDDDSSPISGTVQVELDDTNAPTQITLTDFTLNITDQIDLSIGVFLGSLTATGSNLSVSYAQPGVGITGPLSGNDFTLIGVPTLPSGSVSYDASGTVCIGLSGAGLPCSDTINLAEQGVVIADSFSGTVIVSDNTLTLEASVSLTILLDESDPSLGALTIVGFATGSADLPRPPTPCEGDIDGDDDADSADLNILLGNFGMSVTPDTNGDLDGDGLVNSADLNILLAVFGSAC